MLQMTHYGTFAVDSKTGSDLRIVTQAKSIQGCGSSDDESKACSSQWT
jgi:hypothetical protein